MNAKVNCGALSSAVRLVSRGVANNSTIPIMGHICMNIDSERGIIEFVGGDTEIEIRSIVPCQVDESVKVTVPSKKISDFSGSWNQESTINIKIESNDTKFQCQRSRVSFAGYDYEDYPFFRNEEMHFLTKISAQELRENLQKVAWGVAVGDTRVFLNGVLFAVDDGILSLVASNGSMLVGIGIEVETDQSVSAVISGRSVKIINEFLASADAVEILKSPNSLCFKTALSVLYLKLMDVSYYDYKKVIFDDSDFKVKCKSTEFASVLNRSCLFVDKKLYPSCKFELIDDVISIRTVDENQKSSNECLDVKVKSKGTIASKYNPKYLLNIAKHSGDELSIELSDKARGMKIVSDNYYAIVAPMN